MSDKRINIIGLWETQLSEDGLSGRFYRDKEKNNDFIVGLFGDLDIFTIKEQMMMALLSTILFEKTYIIVSEDFDISTIEDKKTYIIMFEGESNELVKYPFTGKIVYGKQTGNKVTFSDTNVPHLFLFGLAMRQLIEKGAVTPVCQL